MPTLHRRPAAGARMAYAPTPMTLPFLTLSILVALGAGCSSSTQSALATGESEPARSEPCGEPRHPMALAVVCEQRTFTLAPRDLVIDGSTESDVTVVASDRSDIEIVATVKSIAPTEAEARQLVEATRVQLQGTIRAVPSDRSAGPNNRSVTTNFEVRVPRTTNLDVTTGRGSISVVGVSGEIQAHTSSGGVSLRDLSGHVRATTESGGITAALNGDGWDGRGLDMASTSGRISVSVSETYSANVEATSQWGRVSLDGVPLGEPAAWRDGHGETVSGRLREGGASIKATTVNGVVVLQRSR